jgi:hypothetical protein
MTTRAPTEGRLGEIQHRQSRLAWQECGARPEEIREESVMKFVVTWKVRSGGSAADNEAAAARTLEVFGKWSPPSDETFHQFLGRLDGTGGFAVIETDNPDSLAEAPAKFGTYLDFEIIPVNDITETTRLLGEGVEFRNSI